MGQPPSKDHAIFDVAESVRGLPETSDTLVADHRFTDDAAASARVFRVYRRWQLSEAERHPAMRDALSDPETAYVLMTANGKPASPSTVTKIATWHGIRAGVGLKKGDASFVTGVSLRFD